MNRHGGEKAGGGGVERPREGARALAREAERGLSAHPFRPHPLLKGGHAQTLAAWAWPGRVRAEETRADEKRLFEVEPGVRILARCRWHGDRAARLTVVLIHGLGGSADAPYVVGAARLAHRAGANVIRLNQRNCGGTEHLTPTLYHSGMSGDLAAVVSELGARDGLTRVLVAGFSMGGNLALKMAGEMGDDAPSSLLGVCAVSPALDLAATVTRLEKPSNYAYERTFAQGLRRLVVRKKALYPALYDTRALARARTVRGFDELYTAPHGGFEGASDYYERASAIRGAGRIKVPTLIIHAQDDPLVPFAPLRRPEVLDNPHITLAAPPHGGHVAFVSASKAERFWAEGRLAWFLDLLSA
ncbi:MAG: Hydrolase, alpha/beta fold family functionally coupled to Phosphoribulokinase [uncultured Rubrobacteraceae bacterium]|uniref:Hydrolase, alpha/beta fold family functionally coupled to Phosphoribulokinase n=1 Tax=uncultured Rubrobacteraceae bacterium TaxID=349277 RepID=A0A6J4R4E0_9ACTN|nr:MAG: Hydrolase, alpha/beta fold family functionally coupled to Phosphoribulokinase [uncultured Rubrobacteraceae bacterium]